MARTGKKNRRKKTQGIMRFYLKKGIARPRCSNQYDTSYQASFVSPPAAMPTVEIVLCACRICFLVCGFTPLLLIHTKYPKLTKARRDLNAPENAAIGAFAGDYMLHCFFSHAYQECHVLSQLL
ncbi:hypothetical protein Ccrd_024054 [Cynara cardunculus var. scolymus]|uniref:Uncharacterized protein n=1 Tax=Cynara cardunculus var. scolymus TaxID=59895 RepID=A0A103XCW9_CYNCS|nr:hypothetical protein Ccrd_024054 [Cynara cardunculus var. scolymus]